MKLWRFSGEDLALSSWWSILDAKLAVSGRMDLMEDIAGDENREMRSNTFGMTYPFLLKNHGIIRGIKNYSRMGRVPFVTQNQNFLI